jgi:glycosyltransferase involved in cell wall biosynthesis
MHDLVTVGIPVYKRLQYLPNAIGSIAAQDYPNIELLVSDNGMNGSAILDIVDRHYRKPYRFRRNPVTVGMSVHCNQLIEEAWGKYFMPLQDDDEISPNYVSALVSLLEKHPEASIAFSVQESIDGEGTLLSRSKDTVPEILSGPDFVRAIWGTGQYGFHSLSTYLARRDRLRAVRGYHVFPVAQYDDDVLVAKACIDNFVVFSIQSVYRKRYHKSSDQTCLPIKDLAASTRDFLQLLDTDPVISDYAASHSAEWIQSKRYLVRMAWETYYYRWAEDYRSRIPRSQWTAAAFAMPFIPQYYKSVIKELISEATSVTLANFKKRFPGAYAACRRLLRMAYGRA